MKITPHVENLIVLRDSDGQQAKNDNNLLRLMVCNEPFGSFILSCLNDAVSFGKTKAAIAIPQKWKLADLKGKLNVVRYTDTIPVALSHRKLVRENSWICISDGRFFSSAENRCVCETLANSKADVLAVNVVAQLRASCEKVLTASQNELVGFRLYYEDSVQPAPVPDDWPQHLFVRAGALKDIQAEGGLPLAFGKLLEICRLKSFIVNGANVGGFALDLNAENDLLKLVQRTLGTSDFLGGYLRGSRINDITIADSARLFGSILFGKGVHIGANAVVVGPTILGNDARIGKDAVVKASVIGPGANVQAGELIEERVLTDLNGAALKADREDIGLKRRIDRQDSVSSNFREWSRFSYAGFAKRAIDVIASVIVLVLFAPVVPIIMLLIKLTSPGPIFFRDTRQGLHGRPFKCLKFRTMQVGAHRMQDRLRVLSIVDGPQFMIPDDPRMNAVGRFLRETYIDEIPQFVNVLLGQMSVVGPRPSPESENRLCPFWRDARLSVRPGITGLWQICRTRQPMKDFQEWIHYDVRYVRDLSVKLDLWISWKTVKKMAAKFLSQF